MLLCERAPAYHGAVRARAEQQDAGDDPGRVDVDLDDEDDLEDEVPRQELEELELTMEVHE